MSSTPEPESYRVLARKYRPTDFSQLIGQDALVRTLTNAIEGGRIAHAFMLTGVRGIGKTTTARIIARALNCIGANGEGGPTPHPCGQCASCRAIGEDRHPDVIELDAASRSKVDEMRELLDGVRYRPIEARYKIYIVDEVHMLSAHAFNALLKTLEEPPPHVTFVLATTEIRKVPVTVLSRCQRFDLRRVEVAQLEHHFAAIAEREGAAAEPGALALIARAADGSVRDGLSLLDQAIALKGEGPIGEAQVRDMLGLADRVQIFDLFEATLAGRLEEALAILSRLYAAGGDPLLVLEDLLDLCHWVTRLKVVPHAGAEKAIAEAERVRGEALARTLGVPELGRCWQALLKGLEEARRAPRPLSAVEMALIRLAHLAPLPSPAEALRGLDANGAPTKGSEPAPLSAATPPKAMAEGGGGARAMRPSGAAALKTHARAEPEAEAQPGPRAWHPSSFAAVAERAAERREMRLYSDLYERVHLVRFEPGVIEFRPAADAPPGLANALREKLFDWTGVRWQTVISPAPGEPTLKEQAALERRRRREAVAAEPAVRAVLDIFPDAQIRDVRSPAGAHPSPSKGDERA